MYKERVKEGREGLTGPCERWRATGKGRTVGLGKEEGGEGLDWGLSDMPFSTILPISHEAPSSSMIFSLFAAPIMSSSLLLSFFFFFSISLCLFVCLLLVSSRTV